VDEGYEYLKSSTNGHQNYYKGLQESELESFEGTPDDRDRINFNPPQDSSDDFEKTPPPVIFKKEENVFTPSDFIKAHKKSRKYETPKVYNNRGSMKSMKKETP
jgi:hypothetical protein